MAIDFIDLNIHIGFKTKKVKCRYMPTPKNKMMGFKTRFIINQLNFYYKTNLVL